MKKLFLFLVGVWGLMPLTLMGQNRQLRLDTECELTGSIGTSNPVTMNLLINNQGDVMGSYYYDKNGSERTLDLYGKASGDNLYLEESNSEGLVIGSFEGKIQESIVGTWTNKLNGMSLPFSLKIIKSNPYSTSVVPPPPPPPVPADEAPRFPGGDSAMMSYMARSIKYPKVAQENGTQGQVIVQFFVECDGSITNAKAVRSVSKELDEEALRIINAMPKWTPGKIQGKAVRVLYSVPVNFKLH